MVLDLNEYRPGLLAEGYDLTIALNRPSGVRASLEFRRGTRARGPYCYVGTDRLRLARSLGRGAPSTSLDLDHSLPDPLDLYDREQELLVGRLATASIDLADGTLPLILTWVHPSPTPSALSRLCEPGRRGDRLRSATRAVLGLLPPLGRPVGTHDPLRAEVLRRLSPGLPDDEAWAIVVDGGLAAGPLVVPRDVSHTENNKRQLRRLRAAAKVAGD